MDGGPIKKDYYYSQFLYVVKTVFLVSVSVCLNPLIQR